MIYKGYTATVEFDDSVGRLHERVVNSGPYPIVTFEATDVDDLQAVFQRSPSTNTFFPAKKTASSLKGLSPANSMSGSDRNSTRASHVQRQRAD